jgi:hypothetical protein
MRSFFLFAAARVRACARLCACERACACVRLFVRAYYALTCVFMAYVRVHAVCVNALFSVVAAVCT